MLMPYKKYNKFLVVSIAMIIVSLCCFLYIMISSPIAQYIFLFIIILAISLLGITSYSISYQKGKLDILELPVWYSIWVTLSVAFFGFFGFFNNRALNLINYNCGILPKGLWIIITGILGMWIGYGIVALKTNRFSYTQSSFAERSVKNNVFPFVVMYGVICILRIWRIYNIGISYGCALGFGVESVPAWNQLTIYISEFSLVIVAFVAFLSFSRKLKFVYLWIIIFIELLFIINSGFYKSILWLGLAVYGAKYYSGYRFHIRTEKTKAKVFLYLAITAILFLFTCPIVETFRKAVLWGSVDIHNLKSIFYGIIEAYKNSWGTSISKSFSIIWEKITGRQSGIEATLSIIYDTTPSVIPYGSIKELLIFPVYLIPRFIWKSKPILSSYGLYIYHYYLNAAENVYSWAGTTMFGELYIHGGLIVVLLGSIACGFFMGLLYIGLVVRGMLKHNLKYLLLYLGLALPALDPSTVTGLITGTIHRMIIYSILLWFLFKIGKIKLGSIKTYAHPSRYTNL